jgi:hypothetical protein
MNAELRTHKDFDAWKRSLDLVETIYKATKAFLGEELHGLPCEVGIAVITSWSRRNQLRRAVVSVPSNIARPVE